MSAFSWVVVGVEAGVPWPTKELEISFEGHKLLLRPETEDNAPSAVIQSEPGFDEDQCKSFLRRFLSAYAWVEQGSIREVMWLLSGAKAYVGKGPRWGLAGTGVKLDFLPETTDKRARLALALYREGQSLNSFSYQFLAYFRIINIVHSKGKTQAAWINSTIPKLSDPDVVRRVAKLRTSVTDLGMYLYESGRCAIAHAFSQPAYNPDEPTDEARIAQALPIVRALAEYLIEYELGIQSRRTIVRQHKYQLRGFRIYLGDGVVASLRDKSAYASVSIPRFPSLSIRVRGYERLPALESMNVKCLGVFHGGIMIECASKIGPLVMRFGLDFANERMLHDLERSWYIEDDGTAGAVGAAIDHLILFRELLRNGQLEFWESEKNELWGRSDPVMPVNIDPKTTFENIKTELEALERELKKRRPESIEKP